MTAPTTGRLSGKTAVITGATTGLGFETAQQFIAEGARVIITGQNDERLAAAAEKLGPNATPVKANVRSLADLDQLAANVKESFGQLDILFANAGLGVFQPLEQFDEQAYDDQFDVNVKGLFFTVQKLSPLLKDGASVILNASAVNEKGAPAGSVYIATKAAVRSFARSFATELGARNIRVNALSPGIVHTEFHGKIGADVSDGFTDYVTGIAPLGRVGKAGEIASAAVFLASDDSTYMTAADLVVDGGYMNV